MNEKQKYESPLVTRHEKLLDITGSFGSGAGTPDRGKFFFKEGKDFFKEQKDGW